MTQASKLWVLFSVCLLTSPLLGSKSAQAKLPKKVNCDTQERAVGSCLEGAKKKAERSIEDCKDRCRSKYARKIFKAWTKGKHNLKKVLTERRDACRAGCPEKYSAEKLCKELSEEKLDQACRELNSDGSGEIEFWEFVDWFTFEY